MWEEIFKRNIINFFKAIFVGKNIRDFFQKKRQEAAIFTIIRRLLKIRLFKKPDIMDLDIWK